MTTSEFFKKYLFLTLLIFSFTSVKAGLNSFSNLIFVDDWLIERKIDLTFEEIECRASIPSHANWFGARVRLGPNNELIKPIWITLKANQLLESKLAKVRELLYNCRTDFLFLPNNL